MTFNNILTLMGIILSSGVVIEITKYILTRASKRSRKRAKREEELDTFLEDFPEVKKKLNDGLDDLKMRQMRTNLLLLLDNHRNSPEIQSLGKEYVEAGGNSYIIPLLEDWFDEKDIEYPEWLIKGRAAKEEEKLLK